jgi:hypothetical protein
MVNSFPSFLSCPAQTLDKFQSITVERLKLLQLIEWAAYGQDDELGAGDIGDLPALICRCHPKYASVVFFEHRVTGGTERGR